MLDFDQGCIKCCLPPRLSDQFCEIRPSGLKRFHEKSSLSSEKIVLDRKNSVSDKKILEFPRKSQDFSL